MALLPLERSAAEDHPFVEQAVVAHGRRLADDDAHAVVDEDPPPEACARVDLDARPAPVRMREQPRRQHEATLPHRMRRPVQPERMQARIDEQHLERVARCGVEPHDGLDVFGDDLQQRGEIVRAIRSGRQRDPRRRVRPIGWRGGRPRAEQACRGLEEQSGHRATRTAGSRGNARRRSRPP